MRPSPLAPLGCWSCVLSMLVALHRVTMSPCGRMPRPSCRRVPHPLGPHLYWVPPWHCGKTVVLSPQADSDWWVRMVQEQRGEILWCLWPAVGALKDLGSSVGHGLVSRKGKPVPKVCAKPSQEECLLTSEKMESRLTLPP